MKRFLGFLVLDVFTRVADPDVLVGSVFRIRSDQYLYFEKSRPRFQIIRNPV